MQQPGAVGEGNGEPSSSGVVGSAPASSLLDQGQRNHEGTKPDCVPGVSVAVPVPGLKLTEAIFGSAPSVMQAAEASVVHHHLNNHHVDSTQKQNVDTSTPSSSRAAGVVEKRSDDMQMTDPFKRKRVSKRPIPTSTTRRQRQEDPSMISANTAGAAAATCVHDIFTS